MFLEIKFHLIFTFVAEASKQFVNLNICGRLFCVQITLFSNICTADVLSIAASLYKQNRILS